ncbi:hypothetical protein HGB47_07105 [Leptospira yasudae]|uniref:LIC_13246 family protein n=1 Tax=Leptospira yasudae TaxID=2202201 RepID=UPI001C4EB2E0|nr:hypothetical protein [Leptospira yasudae]MBW0433382.1 hypothetical protein [Leptospira yasudae]
MAQTIDLNQGEWMKLVSNRKDFLKIVSTLNDFYIPKVPFKQLNEGQKLRVKLVREESENFDVFLKRRKEHEFVIFLRVGKRFESWIHQDGIREAKDYFLEQGKTDHPIFQCPCVSDLYEEHCVFAGEKETKTFDRKDSA